MKLFVYGTLLSGQHANYKLTDMGARLICADKLKASMFTSNWQYPFLLNESSDAEVIGEVYEIGDESLSKCDSYEGFRPEFPERCLFIRSTGTTLSGHDVYYYHAGPRLIDYIEQNSIIMVPIKSGDWKDFEKNDLPIYAALKKQWEDEMVMTLRAAGMIKKPRKSKRPEASLSSD